VGSSFGSFWGSRSYTLSQSSSGEKGNGINGCVHGIQIGAILAVDLKQQPRSCHVISPPKGFNYNPQNSQWLSSDFSIASATASSRQLLNKFVETTRLLNSTNRIVAATITFK
jgi:hypothetical protein